MDEHPCAMAVCRDGRSLGIEKPKPPEFEPQSGLTALVGSTRIGISLGSSIETGGIAWGKSFESLNWRVRGRPSSSSGTKMERCLS